MAMIIGIFPNHEYGIESQVTQSSATQFAVTLRDTDAQLTLPTVKLFSDLDAAIAYAKTLVR